MNGEIRINKSLKTNTEIKIFAKEVLGCDYFKEAETVFNNTVSDDYLKNVNAIEYLKTLVPSRPKRPLYYVNYELSHGKQMQTRIIVSYLGAFMEMNISQLSKELGGFRNFLPFGGVLFRLKGKISNDLYAKLAKYNELFYRQAKHYYENYGKDEHLFSLMDAILCCFITITLYKEISSLADIKYIEPSRKYYK